ncbi:MAG: adenylate/guanylate cyclase domain-containing protein [Verrucomicrobia bacterium]|nr:MAG: adenylate/guanylate cyclase domain-containing protein [Verrucomicrobiota bacterium]PYK49790.1 MAG: adenylate/guanylate cyclase domain-containing protein [Verrucomicrobiota bacterium]
MERRLSAILAADVVGYSRMMGANEAGTLEALKAARAKVVDARIATHQGRLVKLTGDGMLVEFPSVVSAVACAAEVQRAMRDRNAAVPRDERIEFRIGVSLGDVMVEGDDIYGDGVNIAARLERLSKPGGIAISQTVRDHVGNRLDLTFEDCGEKKLKNIEKPVRVYSISLNPDAAMKHEERAQDRRPSVAVLPFTNMSGDPEQEYFSDGITEDIITDLSKISSLFVVARNTAFTYKGKPRNVQQVGQELGVQFLLEGSVRKAGLRVRVTGQLVSTEDGDHVWAERFDRDLTDIFSIQDEITHAIVEQLKVKLLPQERNSIEQTPTDNVEAYTYYLRGRQFLHRHSKSYYHLARRMFAKAIELDPRYARAYAGIADCDSFLLLHYHVDVPLGSILANTDKALALDNRLAEAHASRGLALSVEKRFEESVTEFEQATALDRNSFEAHYLYARASFAQGNFERAATLFERAAEISPDDYQSLILLIQTYRSLGRDEAKNSAARRGVERAERELILHPEDPRPAYLGIAALIEMGENDRAREWIARALVIGSEDPLTQYNVACGYAKLGETEQALDLLERMLPNVGEEIRMWIKHDSDFAGLHDQPRFQKLLKSIV